MNTVVKVQKIVDKVDRSLNSNNILDRSPNGNILNVIFAPSDYDEQPWHEEFAWKLPSYEVGKPHPEGKGPCITQRHCGADGAILQCPKTSGTAYTQMRRPQIRRPQMPLTLARMLLTQRRLPPIRLLHQYMIQP